MLASPSLRQCIPLLLFLSFVSPEEEPLLTKNSEDRCLEAVDAGPCQYFQVKWFWDEADGECKEFHYGGCMGSRNRFSTKQECLKQCRYKMFNPVSVPDLCLLEADQGHCADERKGQWWYFFNSDSGECEKFFFYGCGGNDNKFYSLHMCRKVCGERLSPQIACDQCDVRTSFCKSHGKFNYTCECRVGYEANQYGECVDIDECRGYTAVCDKNAWCTNEVGSHRCECMAAYRGDGKHCTYVGLGRSSIDCKDCDIHATCNNGICQCKEGYQGDGFNCSDVNECLKAPQLCDKNAECINREGSFICSCLPGYAGNGYNCTLSKNACLDKFDHEYSEPCGNENWRPHFFFDHKTRQCQQFWYDGCRGKSRNVFSEYETCTGMCEETNVLTRAEVCWDKFDLNYKNQCLNGHWQQWYYFDHASLTCRQFWYDGCRSDSRNIFEDELTCQWLCESQPMYKSRACLEDFDEGLKKECNGGRWRQQWYFDKGSKKCHAFWYDGCHGENNNIFQDEVSCLQTCENPAKKDPRKPWHNNDKFKMKELLGDVFKPNVTDVCAAKNPCKNQGTCIFVWKKNTHYCKCPPGFHGNNCEKKIEFDPCAESPCHNGATCQAKFDEDDKPTYECYCSTGFGGPKCDQKPCDVNPCLNNGTCRTTRGLSTYFCECQPSFGGKNCDISIGSVPPEEKFGKKVERISSGKEEWIAQMRDRLRETGGGIGGATGAGLKKPGSAEEKDKSTKVAKSTQVADEPYKDPATKKREREEQEKLKAEEKAKAEEEEAQRKKELELKNLEEQRLLQLLETTTSFQSRVPVTLSFFVIFSAFMKIF
ncbi:unnamed protein product [Caenorhabditis auriculariae]|uniref:Uncharacterized protein n=1 Tax=Caenorhabditis auriculariae TaxID=2777116 RepID=A0A8S1HPQ2_9PELO|nr:unnamed protein product [Caenorhabditis auriculariae]